MKLVERSCADCGAGSKRRWHQLDVLVRWWILPAIRAGAASPKAAEKILTWVLQIAKAMVKGYQGNDLTKNNTIMACVKHYAFYGAAEAGRDYNTTDMSRVRMFNEYLPPYKAAVDAGVGSVMASFNEVDGIPATANKFLMTDVFRKQWGFKGFVVTDYTGINEMMDHGMGDLQRGFRNGIKSRDRYGYGGRRISYHPTKIVKGRIKYPEQRSTMPAG